MLVPRRLRNTSARTRSARKRPRPGVRDYSPRAAATPSLGVVSAPVANLTSPDEAMAWLRARASVDASPLIMNSAFHLGTDWQVTPESLPLFLEFLSSENSGLVLCAILALRANGIQITSDETEETDATVHIVTLQDGSVHERRINATSLEAHRPGALGQAQECPQRASASTVSTSWRRSFDSAACGG